MDNKDNNSLSSKSIDVIQKSKTSHHECKICGALAFHSSFGIITCPACKIFFKRNAEKGQEQFKCDFGGNCEINLNTRHVCSSCRLAKCFANGMQIELIRCSRSKQKNKIVTEPTTTTVSDALIPTLNLLQPDQSILTIDQWNYISNIIHCYDEHGAVLLAEQYIVEQNALPIKLRYKSGSISEIYISVCTKIQQIFENNVDYLSLCLQDQAMLIHTTVKHTTGFGGIVIFHQTKLSDDQYTNIIDSVVGQTEQVLIISDN